MKLTLDLNVFLDVFENRQPHFADSAQVMSLVRSGAISGVVPAHGITTIYYLVRKHASRPGAEAAVDQILGCFEIGNLDAAGWRRARLLPIDDLEDAAVAVAAESTNSAFVVTRNPADFARSAVPAITPADFLAQFGMP